jgi:tight adherence protein B
MIIAAVAALVFVAVGTLVVGVWWLYTSGQQVRRRLERHTDQQPPHGQLLRRDATQGRTVWHRLMQKSDLVGQLARLAEQSGTPRGPAQILGMMAAFGAVGGIVGGWRTGTGAGAVITAVVAAACPVLQLLHKRHRRIQRFQQHFADAVDMIARSIRAGNALSASIQLVGEEMAEPIGYEFRHVAEEIRLGIDPGEALVRLHRRIPTEDVEFFTAAVRIQRGSGGNLAEILDRLSEVIRKRFELLSHARVLSSQQRYAAIFVGASPALFSLMFYVLSPGYFDPLIESPAAPMLITAGLTLEAVGAVVIWRIAKIKV